MEIFCLLLGLLYFLSPSQGQEIEKYNFNLPKSYARSVIQMDELLHMEDDLTLNLEQYIEALSQKADTIRVGIQEMTNQYKQRQESEEKPDWNPFNSYSLIRHMQADWMMWQLYMEKPVGQENLDYLSSKMLELPQDNDLEDAAEGIWRIQTVYQLSASDMAKGLLDGVQYNASLTARDCLAIARYLMNQTRWNQAKEWINVAIQPFRGRDPQPEMKYLLERKTELYRTLGQVLIKLNKSEAALTAYQNALKESPYDAELYQEFRLAETNLLTGQLVHDSQVDDSLDEYEITTCCSGRCELPKKLQLYCLYNTTASAFLRLAPIKMEILSLVPYIVLFHDVVSHKNMQLIRNGTKPHLVASSTYNQNTDSNSVVSYRTSKSVWLPWDLNNITLAVTKMLEDATALNMNSSELFQVINYGVGGLFMIHNDVLLTNEQRFNGTEDRIATALLYLSEVQQGGGTVFPYLNLTVFPQPGSVLFWYNLDTRGNEDIFTLHAGCPAIVGSKWVMSKWIFDIGQEFRKPCFE